MIPKPKDRVCAQCNKPKNASEFSKDKRRKDGLYLCCKKCHYLKYNVGMNPDKRKQWVAKNREHLRNYNRQYWHVWIKVPGNKLHSNLSWVIRDSLKEGRGGRKWEELVGYTVEDLVRHIEGRFESWMSWDNYGKGWQIDHILPKSYFKYKSPEDPEFRKCWALENLQPLGIRENRLKSNKILLNK